MSSKKPCQFNMSGFCALGSKCKQSHVNSDGEPPLTTTAFEFYTLWECKPDAWLEYQDSKGMDRIIVKSKRSTTSTTKSSSAATTSQEDDEDYDMGDMIPPPIDQDEDNNTSSTAADNDDNNLSLDEERARIRKNFQERKRKRDLEMQEQQKKEEEELDRIKKARQKIRQQMKEETELDKQRKERERQERIQQERQKELEKRMKEIDPHMVQESMMKDYDSFLAQKWRGKINFAKPRIPLMAPSGNNNAVTRTFRQQILDKFILTFSIRYEYKKKAILYSFESEDRLYRRYADQKRMYWLAGMNTLKSMEEFEEARTLDEEKEKTGVPLVKDEVSKVTSEKPQQQQEESSDEAKSKPKKKKQQAVYCVCGRDESYDSNMIRCDSEDCEREWFHFKCVGLKEAPKGIWYCPKHEKENRESEELFEFS